MSRNRIMLGVAAAAALVLAACGSGGGGDGASTTESDKAADVQVLDYALSRELTAIDAYARALPELHGGSLATARWFRAQEQEHVDAIIKAVRGLGGKTDAKASPLEPPTPGSQADALADLYGVESSLIRAHTGEIADLSVPWPRSLLTSIVANEAQHLVLLRRALGAGPLGAVPDAFEAGSTPPPGEG